jgi:hypothetical protein
MINLIGGGANRIIVPRFCPADISPGVQSTPRPQRTFGNGTVDELDCDEANVFSCSHAPSLEPVPARVQVRVIASVERLILGAHLKLLHDRFIL